MEPIRFTIKLPPITKKNHMQILVNSTTGRPFVAQSKQYKEYEETAGLFLRPRPSEPITEPVNIRYLFYMPTKRKVDSANLISAADDILVRFGILADDNRDIIAGHDGTRVFHSKEHPRTEILIEQLTEADYTQWKQKKGGPQE